MTLILAGIVMIAFGAWFAGAIYMTDGNNRGRVWLGYACGWTFVGVGVLILLGI